MRPMTSHRGRAVALRRDDVDTDQIIPAPYCRRLTKTGYADGLFAGWRSDPGFVLNDSARAGASVLVAKANFGTGSSREHAVWALRDGGFAAVLATSFGDIFLRNALRNGLLAVALPVPAVQWLQDEVDSDPSFEVTIDLTGCRVCAEQHSWPFRMDPDARRMLLLGADEIDMTLRDVAAVDRFEATRPRWLPTVSGSVGRGPDAAVNR